MRRNENGSIPTNTSVLGPDGQVRRLQPDIISEAVRMYLLLAVPATVGVAAVSDVMATALLNRLM